VRHEAGDPGRVRSGAGDCHGGACRAARFHVSGFPARRDGKELVPVWQAILAGEEHARASGLINQLLHDLSVENEQLRQRCGDPCVITFANAYAAAPYCVVTWKTTLAQHDYDNTASAITLTQTATSSNKVNYNCTARSGG